jgi:hypothetical protein
MENPNQYFFINDFFELPKTDLYIKYQEDKNKENFIEVEDNEFYIESDFLIKKEPELFEFYNKKNNKDIKYYNNLFKNYLKKKNI